MKLLQKMLALLCISHAIMNHTMYAPSPAHKRHLSTSQSRPSTQINKIPVAIGWGVITVGVVYGLLSRDAIIPTPQPTRVVTPSPWRFEKGH